jgi:hypothetical protein
MTAEGYRISSPAASVRPSEALGTSNLGRGLQDLVSGGARIKDRTEGRRKALRAAGKFVEGLPAFGYKRAQASGGSDKPRRLEIDPPRAAMVREMFDLCIRGYSAREISRHMRARYTDCRFAHAWIGRALKNRVYTGQLALTAVRPHNHFSSSQLAAQWVDAHEPVVSMETFSRAQNALSGRKFGGAKPGVASKSATWLLRGIMRCGICGAACASHANSKGGRHEHAGYYVCRQRITVPESRRRCHGPFVRQAETDSAVERLTIAHLDKIRGALTRPPPARKVPDFGPRRADIAARRKRLVAAVAAGKLKLDDIDAPIAALDAELAELEAEAAAAEAECTSDTVQSRRSALAFIDGIAEAWAGLTPGERRSVIMTLAERITIDAKGRPAVTWRDASGLAVAVGSAEAPPMSSRSMARAPNMLNPRRNANRQDAKGAKNKISPLFLLAFLAPWRFFCGVSTCSVP